jgi:hypothetical protein
MTVLYAFFFLAGFSMVEKSDGVGGFSFLHSSYVLLGGWRYIAYGDKINESVDGVKALFF